MALPLDLRIPSLSTVHVRIIDTTSQIEDIDASIFYITDIPWIRSTALSCPEFHFLIEHSLGRKLSFDPGIRKDYENISSATNRIKGNN
jgi:hypothetical protein